jgi:hypothetical protein
MKITTEKEVIDYLNKNYKSFGFKFSKKELSIGNLRIDIFAIDKNDVPYIIELKKIKSKHVVGQAFHYLTSISPFKDKIENEINIFNIKWDERIAICVAPEFYLDDYNAAKDIIIDGKVNLYQYSLIRNSRNKIFSLNLEYKGPNKLGPLVLPNKIFNHENIIENIHEMLTNTSFSYRKEYYSSIIIPIFESIKKELIKFSQFGLYPSYTFWDTWLELKLATSNKIKHRASICIEFSENNINFGFSLVHSLNEALKLSTLFKNNELKQNFINNTLSLEEYSIFIPNSGFDICLNLDTINNKGLDMLLSAYRPQKMRDSYLQILASYDENFMKINDAVKLIKQEYNKFKYIFDMLNI